MYDEYNVLVKMALGYLYQSPQPIHQLDVKNAFLNGDLSETVNMHQPPGFVDARQSSQVAYLLIYVDDIILTASTPALLEQIIYSLHNEFDMTDIEALNYFLEFGLQLYAFATTSLVGYTDVDWAGFPSTRKSTLETAWLRNLLCELHSSLSTVTLVYCDNVSVVYMSVNPVQHQRTKHIEIDIHFIRDIVTARQELNNRNAMEISQKAKIRWSIEGVENSKYFHGIMNKKRSQLAIRGNLANGEWILEPHRVKNKLFTHFKKQFLPIQAPSICFDFTFPTRLSSDQVQDLEHIVTYEEISSCLNNAMGSVLINGSPTLEFQFHKGLKQGEVALKVLYKRLYALEMCKSISVAEKMDHPSLSHTFRRMPRGGVKQENYDLLCSKVTDLVLLNISDRWYWSLEGSQEFSVKSSCILIDNTILPKAKVPTRWLRVIPIKKSIDLWEFSTKACSLIR
uniref:Ribonuclease H-like domain-containing protein n=1 Tax=Tanacetum cinerariifolium TaxID=118510 RepID=A0A6L2LK45_TANCI|nr:ribonuclease H-like domain-containing protein [Tanacetum cinerariifolium]